MKAFWGLMVYLKNYKSLVVFNAISNVLMVFFSVISISAFIPFLNILLGEQKLVQEKPEGINSLEELTQLFYFHLSNIIIEHGESRALAVMCFALVGIYFFRNLFRYLSLFFMAPIRNGIVRDVRKQLFEKSMDLPLAFFSEKRRGDIISRISVDVQEIQWSILNVLEVIVREPLMIIGSLLMMIYLSSNLTLFVLLLIVVTALVLGGVARTLKKQSSGVQEKLANIIAQVEESIGGLKVIKSFNAANYQKEKFASANEGYKKQLTRLFWRKDLSNPLSEFLGISIVSVLIFYGFKEVKNTDLTVPAFLAFLYAFYSVINPAKSFSTAYYNIQKGMAAVDRVNEILHAEVSVKNSTNPIAKKEFQKAIEYKNVRFAYDEQEVLKNINLKVNKGQVVALVGPSGGGKSTLVDLLPRFYDIHNGELLIDDINIKEIKLEDLRSLMGIVTQEPILFNDTIYNNIVFGLENVKPEQVYEAAKIANAHDFILETTDAYETNIGDRGTKLSGGQRQRLTIARAILRNPPILILDEATSALDTESERLVQDAIKRVMENRTAIIIAHRLSTIQHADEIIVIKDGKIIEQGSHAELILDGGEYQKLVKIQGF